MRLFGKMRLPFLAAVLFSAAASAQTVTEFPLPEGTQARSLVAGPDGKLWFVEHFRDAVPRIGRMTTTGTFTDFEIQGPSLGWAWEIAPGPDGNLWFTEADDGQGAIVRITPEGEQTLWPAPRATVPFGITAGPDRNLWLTFGTFGWCCDSGAVARTTTAGEVTVFSIAGTAWNTFDAVPSDITGGADGNVWFTETDLNRIGRLTPSGAMTMTQFSLPTPGSGPTSITVGSDGNLWFTESGANQIGRITPDGAVTEFPIPTHGVQIVSGPDGALWFTLSDARVGRITTSGVFTEIPIPVPGGSITMGPDGNLWFTGAGSIWRLTVPRLPTLDARILPVVVSTAGMAGSFFRTSVQLHNPTETAMLGRVVFHPSGHSGGDGDASFPFAMYPGQTLSIADLLPAMGLSGLGSADIEATSDVVPTTTVRVFNEAGVADTTGFTEEPLRPEDALRPGQSGLLLLPGNLTNFRFNVGVRTLAEGAAATLTLRDASGAQVATLLRDFPGTYHEQQTANALLGAVSFPPGGSISITVTRGAAIFYGATVDNGTGDPSLQVARAAS